MRNTIKTRRAISPILATVILIGVTVAGGGAVFASYQETQDVLSATGNVIVIRDAEARVTDNLGTITFTIINVGDRPWDSVAVTAVKDKVPARIFYKSLNFIASDGSYFANDPLTVSAVTDFNPGDGNGGLVGYSNLILWDATPFAGAFGVSVIPDTICASDDATSLSWITTGASFCDTSNKANLNSVMELPAPLAPGKSLTASAFLFTELPPGMEDELSSSNQIDLVQAGDELILEAIVTFLDGSQSTKSATVKVL